MKSMLNYQGTEIGTVPAQGVVSLTDCWRAAGSPEALRPSKWLRLPGPSELVKYVGKNLSVLDTGISTPFSGGKVVQTKIGGNDSGTWAHWHIALAYSQDLSPAFRYWAMEQMQEVFSSKQTPRSPLPERHVIRGIAQLERHLKRLQNSGIMSGAQAADTMSRALEICWGIRLPRAKERQRLQPKELAKIAKDPQLPPAHTNPEPVEPDPPARVVEVSSDQEVVVDRTPSNSFTGNGAAMEIDRLVPGAFTNWMHHKHKSAPHDMEYPRDAYGREFHCIMRMLDLNPSPAKGYNVPPASRYEGFAALVEAPALRSRSDGMAGTGTRTSTVFFRPALQAAYEYICREMGLGFQDLPLVPPEA